MGFLRTRRRCSCIHLVSPALLSSYPTVSADHHIFLIRAVLLGHGPRSTFNAGGGVRSGYIRGAGFVALLTMIYPIAWGCCEGGNVVSPTGEMIWYGILDLLLGPVFLFYFVWGLRGVDYGLFGLNSGKYTDGPYGSAGGAPGARGPNMAARV